MSVLIFLGHFCFGQNLSTEVFALISMSKDSTHIILEDYFPDVKKTAYRITHKPKGIDKMLGQRYFEQIYRKLNFSLPAHGFEIFINL